MSNLVKANFDVDLGKKVEEFSVKNKQFEGLEVDLGTYLKTTKTGKFQSKENEKVIFDQLNCVILGGRPQYNLWGKDGSPQEDTLLISVESHEEAINEFERLSAEDSVFGQLYSVKDIQERYIITLVNEDGNMYAINMSRGGKLDFGAYAKFLFNTHNCGANKVITKITTIEKTSGKNSWLGLKFEMISKLEEKVEPKAEGDK